MIASLSRRALLRAFAVTLCSALAPTLAHAQDFPRYGDDVYQPRLRQPGKDVMWLPTPDSMVTRMLQAAGVTSKDLVYDLGAGEGRIPIAAAKQFGARAVGIEYDKDLAALAARNAQRAGVADKVRIIEGDIFKEDFSQATVVTMYLLPDLNFQLRPQLLAMKPGTRIVSHMWDMGEWEPDEAMTVGESQAFLWRVPAQVAGRWSLVDDQRFFTFEIDVAQKFQRIGGTYTLRGATRPLLGAYLNGTTLGFTFVDFDDSVRSVRVEVAGDRMRGQLRFAGNDTPISGTRKP